MHSLKIQAVHLTTCLFVAALTCGCHSKGTEPRDEKYTIYMGNGETEMLYFLDADSMRVYDSIPDLGLILSIAVSPDGQWVYTQSFRSSEPLLLTKIDVAAGTKVAEMTGGKNGFLSLIDDGHRMLRGVELCRLERVDPVAWTIIDTLPDSACPVRGPVSGTKVAALIGSPVRVRVLDTETGEISGEYSPTSSDGLPLKVWDCVLHPDNKRVLLIAGVRPLFIVADIETAEVLLQQQLSSGMGEIVVSTSGKFAAVTDPGSHVSQNTPPELLVVDLEVMEVAATLSALREELWAFFNHAVFTPDDRFLYLGGDRFFTGPLQRIDLSTMSLDTVSWEGVSLIHQGALAIGLRLP